MVCCKMCACNCSGRLRLEKFNVLYGPVWRAMSCRLVDPKPDLVQARIKTINPEHHCCVVEQTKILRSDAYNTTDNQFNLRRLSIGQARNSCDSKTPQPQTKNVELESRCSAKLSYGSRISKWILSELVIRMVREYGAILKALRWFQRPKMS